MRPTTKPDTGTHGGQARRLLEVRSLGFDQSVIVIITTSPGGDLLEGTSRIPCSTGVIQGQISAELSTK